MLLSGWHSSDGLSLLIWWNLFKVYHCFIKTSDLNKLVCLTIISTVKRHQLQRQNIQNCGVLQSEKNDSPWIQLTSPYLQKINYHAHARIHSASGLPLYFSTKRSWTLCLNLVVLHPTNIGLLSAWRWCLVANCPPVFSVCTIPCSFTLASTILT